MVQMKESSFLSSDGKSSVYYREYLPEGEVRAVMQISHGLSEHIGRYDDFARFLAENGFAVFGNDHLGHGRTAETGTLGLFSESSGWEKVVADMHTLHEIALEKYPGKPSFLFGHSMGSFLARTYIIRFPKELSGVILAGTGQMRQTRISAGLAYCAAEIRRHGPAYVSDIVNRMNMGRQNDAFKNARTPYDWLSRDKKVVDAYIADPLCGFKPSVSMFHDMLGGMEFFQRQRNLMRMRQSLPVFFMSGDQDPVGEMGDGVIRAYRSFVNAGMSNVTLQLYHNGRHEMLNELEHEKVYAAILAWLRGCMER